MAHDIQTVVVGAGVVGTAIARELACSGHEVLILEREESGHHHTSARNSQVIHAGMYYPIGSLKARFCVEGRKRLYDFCRTRHVPHKQIGKLICATSPDQIENLQALCERGLDNGIDDLRMLSKAAAEALEPALECVAALSSPSTGIVDAPIFMKALLGEAESQGAVLATHAALRHVQPVDSGFVLSVDDNAQTKLTCKNLINASGLGAWDVARNTVGFNADLIPHQSFVKGCYFSLGSGKAPFQRLIYPMAERHSLGVHYIIDMGGRVTFGPNVMYLDTPQIDYANNAEQAHEFAQAIRRFWPGLPLDALQPDTCGIRPRITRPEDTLADFRILGPIDHGMSGLVQLFGIESPGLTSSLGIAAYVAKLV